MPHGSAGYNYGSGSANSAVLIGTTSGAHASSRSQSNKPSNGRKSNSIKYKSAKANIVLMTDQSKTLAARQQAHSRQGRDSK